MAYGSSPVVVSNTPDRKFPAEILVYKRNGAPLFRERFWSSSPTARERLPYAKTILLQAAWRCCDGWRAAKTAREVFGPRGPDAGGDGVEAGGGRV
jgi:hypothetical protein